VTGIFKMIFIILLLLNPLEGALKYLRSNEKEKEKENEKKYEKEKKYILSDKPDVVFFKAQSICSQTTAVNIICYYFNRPRLLHSFITQITSFITLGYFWGIIESLKYLASPS
jgi:hypothetical protein